MGKIIQNCPCCMRGICTCCCSKTLGRKMTVSFQMLDSDDGNGSPLTCCLDGVSIEVTYTVTNNLFNEILWLGEASGDCGQPIWVAVRCPPEGRSLIVGVACGDERPIHFSLYQFFSKNIKIEEHGHPYKYGFNSGTINAQSLGVPTAVINTFSLEEPVAPFDEEAYFSYNAFLARVMYVPVPLASTNKTWWFNSNIMWAQPPATLPANEIYAGSILIKNTDVSDVILGLSGNNFYNSGHGIILRKNDTGFIWIWFSNNMRVSIWKVTGIDTDEIELETLAGLSYIDSMSGNTWLSDLVTGDGLTGALTTGFDDAGDLLMVAASGDTISVYSLGKKIVEVTTDFNQGATSHGLFGNQNANQYVQYWRIWNYPADISYVDGCNIGSTLEFTGNLYSGYGDSWPSQDLSNCGCSPASEAGSYLNIRVTVTSTLTDRECDEDCSQAICDDCYYNPCVLPSEIKVMVTDPNLFTTTPGWTTDLTLFNTERTLYKLTKYDNAFLPNDSGFSTVPIRQNVPVLYDSSGSSILWDGSFQDDLGVPSAIPGEELAITSCIYVSDFFDVELDESSDIVDVIENELSNDIIARTQRVKFRWQLNIGGRNDGSGELIYSLCLVCERETYVIVYEMWTGYTDSNSCDGPWELTYIDADFGISGIHVARGAGGNPWLETPETIIVQPVLPADMSTLNVVCPYCCDGEAYVGRNLLLDIDDENNDSNDINGIQLTMDIFGQCITSTYYNGDALFQWSSEELLLSEHPELVSWGDDCSPNTITSWTIKLQCRFHQMNSDTTACPPQSGLNCRSTWRFTNCGHFDWVLLFIPNVGGCYGNGYPYSSDIDFNAGDPSFGGYGTMLPTELTSGCNPFYVSGEIQQLGPNSVTRNVVIHE